MRKLMVVMAMALILCGGIAMSAQAFVIDFEIQPIQDEGLAPDASVTYAGGATNLVGSNIRIDKITGIGTPLHAGNANALTNTDNTGLWNFTSGTFTGSAVDHWFFDSSANSSLNISGTFTNATTLGSVTDPVPLAQDNWINAEVHRLGVNNAYAITGAFTDFKAEDLLTYFGISDQQFTATFTFGAFAATDILPPDAFTSSSVSSGDISQVPVPPAVWLFGSGLLGLVGLRRKLKA